MGDRLTGPQTSRTGVAALGVGVVAVCCAALPLLAGLLGVTAVGSVIGVGGGVLAVVVVSVLIMALSRRRRAGAAMRHGGES